MIVKNKVQAIYGVPWYEQPIPADWPLKMRARRRQALRDMIDAQRNSRQWDEYDAADEQRSYYLFLRDVYRMPALQAWREVQRVRREGDRRPW